MMATAVPVTIVGGGPCGLGVAMYLRQRIPDASITILEKSEAQKAGSPLGQSCATQAISHNVSESAIGGWFDMMEQHIGCIERVEEEDVSLSHSNERPRGWSRGKGQWRHYRCPQREKLFAAMQLAAASSSSSSSSSTSAAHYNYRQGKHVDLLSYDDDGNSIVLHINSQTSIRTAFGTSEEGEKESIFHASTERLTTQCLVLAMPPQEALRVTSSLSLPRCVQQALERCCSTCETRHCKTIRIEPRSEAGRCLFNKFYPTDEQRVQEEVRELDVSSVEGGEITLLVLVQQPSEPITDTETNHHLVVHVHASCSHALSSDALLPWLAKWLSLSLDVINGPTASAFEDGCTTAHSAPPLCSSTAGVFGIDTSGDVHSFMQARTSAAAPLSPLRECGCIVVPLVGIGGGGGGGDAAADATVLATTSTRTNESSSKTACEPAPHFPLLVICGDWAVAGSSGTVSGALLSAYNTAKVVADRVVES